MQELAVRTDQMPALSTTDLKNRVECIRDIQEHVMKKDVDYGKITGCGPKPTLLKPGAETLLLAFELAALPDQLSIQDLGGDDEVRYRVITPIVHVPTGRLCGNGVGECSSLEEKYKWREAVCEEEWVEADPDRRRIKWKRHKGNVQQVKQVRVNKADVANTVLKMGKKRSLVDAALTVTAASRIFTQDVEDLPEEIRGHAESHDEKTSTPATSRMTLPRFGPASGMPIVDATTGHLQFYVTTMSKSLNDPNKAQYRDANARMIAAIEAELSSRYSVAPPVLEPPDAEKLAAAKAKMEAYQDAPAQATTEEVSDRTMQDLFDWIEQSDALVPIAKRVRSDMRITKLAELRGKDRRAFALAMQDAARRANIAMPVFVEDAR